MKKSEDFTAIILAAGKGTRMKSPLAKVLHPVAGTPMISRVIGAVSDAGASGIRVITGHSEELVKQVVEPLGAKCYTQKSQNGTADAVASADLSTIKGTVLIINGDHPLVTSKDIKNLIKEYVNSNAELSVVSSKISKPGSFGRIVRHHGQLKAIVEAKDASAETLKINEVNTGIYVTSAELLSEYIPQIKNNNAQGEYYLTDLITLCEENSDNISAILSPSHLAFGVNSQVELSKATQLIFRRNCKKLMEDGVVVIDPKTTYVEDDVEVGQATVVYPNNYIRSGTKIGKFCVIEPNCHLVKAKLEDSIQVRAGTYIEDASVGSKTMLGPYARLRPSTTVGKEAKIGNFVELKKVVFGDKAQASHLTYLGDAEIGEGTNIGCGTITCNYAVDKKKYVTKIGKNCFIGSDTQFVAPVNIGDNVFVGSGSTITKDVQDGALAITRGKQIVKENYKPKPPRVKK